MLWYLYGKRFGSKIVNRLRLFSSQTFSPINSPTFLKPSHSSHLPAYEDEQCSETSAYKIQTPGNHPEESTQHSEHGEKFEIQKAVSLCAEKKSY
jgi:hypothetical protein